VYEKGTMMMMMMMIFEDAEELHEVQLISEVEKHAFELNPYTRIAERTVADKHYVSKEPDIIDRTRKLILNQLLEMKVEFTSKCICLQCDEYIIVTTDESQFFIAHHYRRS
jgi:hypothetical protein